MKVLSFFGGGLEVVMGCSPGKALDTTRGVEDAECVHSAGPLDVVTCGMLAIAGAEGRIRKLALCLADDVKYCQGMVCWERPFSSHSAFRSSGRIAVGRYCHG